MEWKIPLESYVVPLKECKEGEKPITTVTLVGKVICSKNLNRGAVKAIHTKAWGGSSLHVYCGPGTQHFMFNFLEKDLLKSIMEEGP